MNKLLMFVISMYLICSPSFGQKDNMLSGKVTDAQNQPLTGATVILMPGETGTVTDIHGTYAIHHLKSGSYKVKISFIGYKDVSDTIIIHGDKVYNTKLAEDPLSLQEVVVTDNKAELRKKEESLNIEVVNEHYLKQNLGGSLMKSLERLPGVTTIDIGSGQSKPVIRGLSFNRVVVVENGIKHEGQQWGADHGLEIDQYAVNDLTVLKGPASLMYGSDAIGGVIDIKENNVPVKNSLKGSIDLTGKTNNNLIGTSVMLSGRKDVLFGGIRATWLDYGDYKVPTDSVDIYSYRAPLYKHHLRNTAGEEKDLHVFFGMIKGTFQSKFTVSNVYSKSGFFANAHGLEPRNVDAEMYDKSSRDILKPYQMVNHFKTLNKTQWRNGNLKIELDLGFQRNFRQEWSQYTSHGYMPAVFPDTLDFDGDLERQFDKYIFSGKTVVTYQPNQHDKLSVGLSGSRQQNRIDGRGFIIPAFTQMNLGGFAYAKHAFSEKSAVQVGVRYDNGHLKSESYYDWFPSPVKVGNDTVYQYLQRAKDLDRNFSNISWSVGYNYNPGNFSFKANIGKSFRMPIAKELAANGVNYHHFSYEVGDADISPEISYQFDAGLEYNLKLFAIGATPFVNYFTNYIYLNPSSDHDRLYGNGNQEYYYTESEVFRYGGELHAHYQVIPALQLGLMGEYVYSEQLSGEKKGFTLPFSPPASAIISLRYKRAKLSFIQNAYALIDYRITAAQNNIVPPEETTPGYQVVNVGIGGGIKLGENNLSISLQIQNLTNRKYFNHTSFYRIINVPEAGRNIVLNITIPISGKFKN